MVVSRVIDVLIALCALYVALSCFCSWVNETIQGFLQKRGAFLYQGVLNLISGEEPLVQAIFDSPFVSSTSNDPKGKPVWTGTGATPAGYSLSPSKWWDLIRTKRGYRPSYLDPRAFSLALWQGVGRVMAPGVAADALKTPTQLLADLRNAVQSYDTNAPLKTSLISLLNRAQDDYDQLLKLTDAWFNDQMDRVSGWYTRYAQWWILLISIIVVSILGVDSIQFAGVASASSDLGKITQAVSNAVPTPNPAAPAPTADQAAQQKVALTFYDAVSTADFTSAFHARLNPEEIVDTWKDHWAGMLLTIAAVTLGSPFWFSLLCKLISVRQAGDKPDSGSDAKKAAT